MHGPTSRQGNTMTMTAEEQEQAAVHINERLLQLQADGFRDVALLSLMVEHARTYHRLASGTPSEQLKNLLHRYEGLHQFAGLLVRVAPMLSSANSLLR